MFRRGRYQQLQKRVNASDSESDDRLEFVGTSSEYVSPHRFRSSHPPPTASFNSYHREVAGKEAPARATPTPSNAIATADQLTKVIGILYFMSWTRKTLKNYSNDIRKLFEIPLTERCFGKVENGTTTEETIEASDSRNAAKEIAKKLEKGVEVAETFTDLALIQKRIADAVANPSLDLLENRVETPRQLVTPIELACLSRLRTLVKMSGSWLKKTVEMEAWFEKNRKSLIEHGSEVCHGIEFAVAAFNAVCILGEIFGLEPVDRKSVKKDFAALLEPYERPKLKEYNRKLEIASHVKAMEYIGGIEARINCYRTILHVIGLSTVSLFQIILKALPTELLETTTRAVREVAHRLPPSFRFHDDLKLSPFALRFLLTPPPNSLEFPYGEIENHSATTTEPSTAAASRPRSRQNSVIRSDRTQSHSHSKRSPDIVSAQSNSTQRSATERSPPTARS